MTINISEITRRSDQLMCSSRPWQRSAADDAIPLYLSKDILSVNAVTGGGKTTAAVMIAAYLIRKGEIDRVVCLAPSLEICKGLKKSFRCGLGVNASTSAIPNSDKDVYAVTYQAAAGSSKNNGGAAKQIKGLVNNRTLLVIDEFHHAEREGSWGISVDRLAEQAGKVLALTGTPWKSTGEIALMADYYDKEGNVDCDVNYLYSHDLEMKGNDRATVPVKFKFYDSKARLVGDKEYVVFEEPKNDEEKRSLADDECALALGPHVHITDNELSNNKMAKTMLDNAVNDLGKAKSETKNHAIGLVVAKNIKEAKMIGDYMTEVLEQSVEVITSDDDDSCDEIDKIREGTNKSDWIISVGMVSEGVDIPQLKVLVYLSAITTLLYLIQVIGRILRRINTGSWIEPNYLDKELGEVIGYCHMPAHPKLLYVGVNLEDEIKKAKEKLREASDGDGDPKERLEYENDGGNNVASIYRSAFIPHDIERGLGMLLRDPDANICDETFEKWIISMVDKGAVDMAREIVEKYVGTYEIHIDEEMSFREEVDYDTATRLLGKRAHRTVALIRHSSPVYKKYEDQIAYAAIRKKLNKDADIKSFTTATLEEKRLFIDYAESWHRSIINV